jgi:hypothetical protein
VAGRVGVRPATADGVGGEGFWKCTQSFESDERGESIDRILLFPEETFIVLPLESIQTVDALQSFTRFWFAFLLRRFIKRQRVAVYPVERVFLAEIRGKDDQVYALDATK